MTQDKEDLNATIDTSQLQLTLQITEADSRIARLIKQPGELLLCAK